MAMIDRSRRRRGPAGRVLALMGPDGRRDAVGAADAGGGGSRSGSGAIVRGPWPAAVVESKAHEVLVGLGRRKLRPLDAGAMAAHVLRLYAGAEWAVQLAAFEAVLGRYTRMKSEQLGVARRPRGSVIGEYRVRRGKGGRERPWRTVLASVEPLEASCDCPDFRNASLGLCKHVLCALVDAASRPAVLARASKRSVEPHARLVLDAARPLVGPGDPLAQLRFVPGPGRKPAFARAFEDQASGRGRMKPAIVRDARQRRAAVERMVGWIARGGAAEPAASALVGEELARLRREAVPPEGRQAASAALATLKRPLYPYQREGVERFLESTRLLLADDMGLGKTVQAIAGCHALFESGRARRGLLIVPASLKAQWQWEWESFTDAPITVVDGRPEERRAAYAATDRGFLVVNYELLLRDLDALLAWAPDVVVLDEAQRIKNWETRTARCVKRLDPTYRLVLTGTPLENRLSELASIMDWVDDRAMEPKWRLAPLHHDERGARHLDTLRQRLAPSMLRRRRADVLRQLPERTDIVVPIPLDPVQRDLHDELDQPIARLVAIAKRRPLLPVEHQKLMSLLARQRIVCNGAAQVRFEAVWPDLEGQQPTEARLAELSSPKLAAFREVLRTLVLDQGRKVVVFSQWRRMLRLAEWAVRDLLRERGMRAVFFTGAEDPKKRTRSLVAFHDDPRVVVLFASDAGGVGLNLQRAASCCVQLEVPWNPAVFEQRVARIHRLGQSEPIDVVTLVGHACIEQRIAGLVSAKRALFEGLLDSHDDEVAFAHAESFVDRLERVVDDEATAAEAPAGEAMVVAPAPLPTPKGSLPAVDAPPPASAWPPHPPADAVLASLRVERRDDGSVHIVAPPETAATLVALLEGMARLVTAAAG